jgi:hypothetical protein
MRRELALVLAVLMVIATGCGSRSLPMSCQVNVPKEFRTDPPGWRSPTGEPESVRYTRSYEAFWWNCVIVKSEDLDGRCPFTCSGTPAATYGCADGAMDAERRIEELLERYPAKQVQDHLRSMAADSEGRGKIAPYFPSGPRREQGPQ